MDVNNMQQHFSFRIGELVMILVLEQWFSNWGVGPDMSTWLTTVTEVTDLNQTLRQKSVVA